LGLTIRGAVFADNYSNGQENVSTSLSWSQEPATVHILS